MSPPLLNLLLIALYVYSDVSISLQVEAQDADSGRNGQLTFSIASGDDLNQFTIDSSNGYIRVAAPLDREAVSVTL